jgi:hypothetical protein
MTIAMKTKQLCKTFTHHQQHFIATNNFDSCEQKYFLPPSIGKNNSYHKVTLLVGNIIS